MHATGRQPSRCPIAMRRLKAWLWMMESPARAFSEAAFSMLDTNAVCVCADGRTHARFKHRINIGGHSARSLSYFI